jgi:hypothetical protein
MLDQRSASRFTRGIRPRLQDAPDQESHSSAVVEPMPRRIAGDDAGAVDDPPRSRC